MPLLPYIKKLPLRRNPFLRRGLWVWAILLTMGLGCNPFSPRYDPSGLSGVNVLGDPSSLEGYFQLFKNSYELRDTTLYGRLFASDLTFAYYDADLGQDIQWDRATELQTTWRMFQSVLQIDLDWNYYTQLDSTDTEAVVVRNFTLNIQQDEQTSFSGTGRARMRLRRTSPTGAWEAYYWFDDSDF